MTRRPLLQVIASPVQRSVPQEILARARASPPETGTPALPSKTALRVRAKFCFVWQILPDDAELIFIAA
jgi:hypothetical protein